MKSQKTMKGMILLTIITLFVTACSSNPKKPENVNEKLWKDSIKIVQGIEERMKKGDAPSKEDQVEFDSYYSENESLIHKAENSGTKEEQKISSFVVDCYLLNQEYVAMAKRNDFENKMKRMKMYQERIVKMRELLGYKK